MASFYLKKVFVLLIAILCCLPALLNAQAEDISFEKVKEKCKGIPRENRLRITVTRFSVTSRAAQATGQFGEELTAIMTNALQQTSCFSVLESTKNAKDLNDELGYNESGATDGSGPQRGKQQGAQAIVTAEITEYSEGQNKVSAIGVSVGGSKVKLGLIVKVIDPETRVTVWSKSVNAESKKTGFRGASLFGVNVAGTSKVSEAMSAAVEDIVLRTVDIMVKDKEEIMSNFTIGGPKKPTQWNKENCKMFSAGNAPKVMVIVPETHISSPLPDPAGETEILRKFLEAGFKAVDPSMFSTLRNGAKFSEAVKNPMAAISLGKEFGADIIIFGEGFSQLVNRDNGTVTCRARLEVKAVRTDNAEMLATNGAQAGGQDIVESTSAKTALKNAGAQIGDYLLEQFCTNGMEGSAGSTSDITGSTTMITVQNTNFAKLNTLAAKLKANTTTIKDVSKTLKGAEGTLTIVHEGSTDDLATFISTLGAEYEITGVDKGIITISLK